MPLVRGGGHGHRVRKDPHDWSGYIISWRYDVKIGRLRSERRVSRDTDEAGAERFAKKWGLAWPLKEGA